MFAHDLYHSRIKYLSNSTSREPLDRTIDLNRKDRAKRYHKSSIVNIQFRLVRVGISLSESHSLNRVYLDTPGC